MVDAIRIQIGDGTVIEHGGLPPFKAATTSRKDPNWPVWYVSGRDGVNRLHVPGTPGPELLTKDSAISIAEALNASLGPVCSNCGEANQ